MDEPLIPQWIVTVHEYDDAVSRLQQEYNFISRFLSAQDAQEPPLLYLWYCIQVDSEREAQYWQEVRRKVQSVVSQTFAGVQLRVLVVPYISTSLEDLTAAFAPYIHKISVIHPLDRLGQVVGTGDPAVAHAFFIEAIKQWEDRYVSLYPDDFAYTAVDTPALFVEKSWHSVFRQLVLNYDYRDALQALNERIRLQGEEEELTLVKHALKMLVDRLNFAFRQASVHLKPLEAIPHPLIAQTKEILNRLLLAEGNRDGDLERIAELYRHLDLYLEMDQLHSFFIRFYRAREAVLQFIYRYGGDAVREAPTSLHVIHQLIEQIEEDYAKEELYRYVAAYFYAKSKNVTDTLQLRNVSIVGHGRRGFRDKSVWEKYTGYGGHPMYKSKLKFERDSALVLRDLGTDSDEHFSEWNQWILTQVSKGVHKYEQEAAAANSGTDTTRADLDPW